MVLWVHAFSLFHCTTRSVQPYYSTSLVCTLVVCEKEPESDARTNGPSPRSKKTRKDGRMQTPTKRRPYVPSATDVGEEPSKTGRGSSEEARKLKKGSQSG